MTSREILQTILGQTIINRINEKIVQKYKVEPDQSRPFIENLLLGNHTLLEMIRKEEAESRILKSKAFKTIQSTARRKVYYHLRQYTQDTEQLEYLLEKLQQLPITANSEKRNSLLQSLAATHVSSKERLEELGFFYKSLFDITGPISSILDIGCGIQPLTFPFWQTDSSLEKYLALEKDVKCIPVLKGLKKLVPDTIQFEGQQWDIKEGWSTAYSFQDQLFDLALMLKLIPVVNRNDPDLIETLLNVPAKKIVLSGSRLAMAKKEDIEYRERKIIQSFIDASQREIIGEFKLKEEFIIVLS